MLEHSSLVCAQPRAVIGRHQHDHRSPGRRRFACALGGDARAEMAAGDDDRHTTRKVREADIDQRVAFRIGEQKLFGIVRENADPVDTLIDHAIEHATLPVDVEIA